MPMKKSQRYAEDWVYKERNPRRPQMEVSKNSVYKSRVESSRTGDADRTRYSSPPNLAPEAHGRGHLQDVDCDDDLDLVLRFNTQDAGIACGDTSATLIGLTCSGQPIQGSHSVKAIESANDI